MHRWAGMRTLKSRCDAIVKIVYIYIYIYIVECKDRHTDRQIDPLIDYLTS